MQSQVATHPETDQIPRLGMFWIQTQDLHIAVRRTINSHYASDNINPQVRDSLYAMLIHVQLYLNSVRVLLVYLP